MGMPKIELRLQMFRGDWDQVWSQIRLLWAMEGLCRINQSHIRQFDAFKERGLVEKSYPSVYRAGLHYETEKGTEIWPDIPSLFSGVMGEGVYPGPWGDCLPVSTLVLMRDYTFRPIAALAPGDEIMGDGGWTRVVDQAITGRKPILALELNNGCTLRCSPNHRLFLANGEEVRAEDVKPNMHLRTPTKPFPAGEEMTGDGRLGSNDLAWLVGFYVADGWHEMPRRGRFAIAAKDGFKKEPWKKRVKALMDAAGVDTRWDQRYIAVNDKALASIMATCGGHHASEKRLPTLDMSLAQVRAVLEGLKGDASFANSGTVTHGTTSPMLALQTRILYRMLGQSTHIKRWDKHGGLGSHPMYRIGVRRSDEEVGDAQHARRHSARVVSISEDPAELCADITTDTGRFYLPESDLVVHNCEDFACVRVAEYRELPWHYRKRLTTNDGKSRLVLADPRFPQGDWDSAIAAELPSSATYSKDLEDPANWPGWEKVKGGIAAKPFAKWRRGPKGNYHYHAIVLMPDGRLEDPSLVLGMGRERQFHEDGMAEKMKDPSFPVRLQYAKPPSVMVVDPEKPSGYSGGQAVVLDAKIKELVEKGMAPEDIAATLGDAEIGAYLANEIPLGEGEFDVDAVIGWNRLEGRFEPKTESHELRRLTGYAGH